MLVSVTKLSSQKQTLQSTTSCLLPTNIAVLCNICVCQWVQKVASCMCTYLQKAQVACVHICGMKKGEIAGHPDSSQSTPMNELKLMGSRQKYHFISQKNYFFHQLEEIFFHQREKISKLSHSTTQQMDNDDAILR